MRMEFARYKGHSAPALDEALDRLPALIKQLSELEARVRRFHQDWANETQRLEERVRG